MWDLLAIECAKIAVDEIIESINELEEPIKIQLGTKVSMSHIIRGWQEVKNELNKMS